MKKHHKIGKKFIQESVVGVGFINGIWINVGLNPESEIYNMIASGLATILPEYGTLFFVGITLLSFGLIAKSLLSAYKLGNKLGILAVGLAFIGGILMNQAGVLLLFIAAVIGYLSCIKIKFI